MEERLVEVIVDHLSNYKNEKRLLRSIICWRAIGKLRYPRVRIRIAYLRVRIALFCLWNLHQCLCIYFFLYLLFSVCVSTLKCSFAEDHSLSQPAEKIWSYQMTSPVPVYRNEGILTSLYVRLNLPVKYAHGVYTSRNSQTFFSRGCSYSWLTRQPCWWWGIKEYFINSIVGTSHSGRATLSGDSREIGRKSRIRQHNLQLLIVIQYIEWGVVYLYTVPFISLKWYRWNSRYSF